MVRFADEDDEPVAVNAQSNLVDLNAARRRTSHRATGQQLDEPINPRKDGRSTIKIVAGALPLMTDEANDLLADPAHGVFRRGTALVRPVSLPANPATISIARREGVERPEGAIVLQPVDAPALRDVLGRGAHWIRFDERKSEWVYRDPPEDVAKQLIARRGDGWSMSPLKAVVRTPTLRPDGSILATVGYDALSHLFFASDCEWPEIKPNPDIDDARNGIDLLAECIRDLPFVEAADRSAILAMILTSLIRPVLPTAPLFAVTAPTAGTGKSLAVDLAAILQTGVVAPVINGPSNDEELEKRLGSSLMAGDPIISLDNLTAPLRSDFLCSVLTQEAVTVRVLGESKKLTLSTSALFAATGNNLSVAGDMTRRVILSRLDARSERPEDRSFDWDARQFARDNRAELVMGALTALRAFVLARPTIKMTPMGSFEAWSEIIRGCLMWCGYVDPLANKERLREDDPERERLFSILDSLRGYQQPFSAADIAARAQMDPERFEWIRTFMERGTIKTTELGYFFKKHKDRTIEGLTLRKTNAGTGGRVATYRVE